MPVTDRPATDEDEDMEQGGPAPKRQMSLDAFCKPKTRTRFRALADMQLERVSDF